MKKKSGPIHTMFPWDRVQGGFQESVCAREFVTILIIPEKISSSPQERNDCISGKDYNEFIVIGDVLDFILSRIFSNECGLLFWSCFWSVLRAGHVLLNGPLHGRHPPVQWWVFALLGSDHNETELIPSLNHISNTEQNRSDLSNLNLWVTRKKWGRLTYPCHLSRT